MINDSWADDEIGLRVVQPIEVSELPQFLKDLRDGTAEPNLNEGQARVKRLEKMAKNVHDLSEFVNDLDRYAEHAKTAPLVGRDVGIYMGQLLKDIRAKVVAEGKERLEELQYVRSH